MNIYDEALKDMNEMENIPYMKDILSVKSNQNMWGRMRKLIIRAEKVEELLSMYRRTYQPSVLHPLNEQINELEEELVCLKLLLK